MHVIDDNLYRLKYEMKLKLMFEYNSFNNVFEYWILIFFHQLINVIFQEKKTSMFAFR